MSLPAPEKLIVGIVGPCGAGKSTLIRSNALKQYELHHIAQEHSYVPDMWKKISNPDILIFLDASYPATIKRKKLDWSYEEYLIEQQRLANARENADLYIDTTELPSSEVEKLVSDFLAIYTKNSDFPYS